MATLLNTPRAIVLPTQDGDCDRMAPHLRAADLLELRSVAGEFTNYALPLQGCVRASSMAWSIFSKSHYDYPAAIFGVAPSPSQADTAHHWLMGTPLLVSQLQRDFLRFSRDWVQILHAEHPVLRNIVHAENKVHIRWLSFLGVNFTKVHLPGSLPIADPSQTFIEFEHTL